MLVVGPNGAGKTNLLEGLHVALQGFSLRTRRDARAVRFGASGARLAARGTLQEGRPFVTGVAIRADGGRDLTVDRAPVSGAELLRRRFPVLAFTPDRLAVVKGGPLVRRVYLDRAIGRILPARADLPGDYARALAQRNAALRRVRAGDSRRESVVPWTEAMVRLGTELDASRSDVVAALAERFTARAEALGLPGASLAYSGEGLSSTLLEERLARDVERGTTGAGPHLQDLSITAGDRELRSFGSQGEQRVAVLALVLAEADVLAGVRDEPPLLLLDDVLSELDDHRRAALGEAFPAGGQTVVTATSLRSLPPGGPAPSVVVDVVPGRATVR